MKTLIRKQILYNNWNLFFTCENGISGPFFPGDCLIRSNKTKKLAFNLGVHRCAAPEGGGGVKARRAAAAEFLKCHLQGWN